MSIYRWAKLDDQSGPDRSIELTSISGWAGKKPSQEGLVFGSVARLPLVGPEQQWVGPQKPQAISNTHTERRIPEQSTQVVSSSISGSLTIGNESPFQAHSVLESSSDFRLILRLENAVFTNPPGWFVGVSDNWPQNGVGGSVTFTSAGRNAQPGQAAQRSQRGPPIAARTGQEACPTNPSSSDVARSRRIASWS